MGRAAAEPGTVRSAAGRRKVVNVDVGEEQVIEGPPPAFEKMRQMLGRASEMRAEEQRQMVELIDEVRSRLKPIESHLADSKPRLIKTQDAVGAIQERLNAAFARIDAQDEVLQQITTVLAGLADRVGRPLEAIEARLDGVAGRFEGISGRLDGVDDRMQHLHSRLDEMDGSLGRTHAAVEGLPGALDLPAVHGRFDELAGAVHQRFDEESGKLHGRFDEVLSRPAVDPTEQLDGLGGRLEGLGDRIDEVEGRIRHVDESVRNNAGTLAGSIEQGVDKLHGAVHERPDRSELDKTLRAAQQESERRIVQQLDSVLAAFAEVVISRPKDPAPAAPRTSSRKPTKKQQTEAEEQSESGDE
jgi:archaellum component FlaC